MAQVCLKQLQLYFLNGKYTDKKSKQKFRWNWLKPIFVQGWWRGLRRHQPHNDFCFVNSGLLKRSRIHQQVPTKHVSREILSGISWFAPWRLKTFQSSSNYPLLGANCWFLGSVSHEDFGVWIRGAVFCCVCHRVFGGTWNAFEPFSSPSRTGLVSLVAVCRTPRRKAREDSHVEAFFKKRWDTCRIEKKSD